MMKKALTVLAAVAMFGCTPEWARENNSNLLMRVAEIEGTPGGEGEAGAILLSDICCAITNDQASVTVEVVRKNPFQTSTPLEDVILTRYEVRYFRTDGHNREGIDVPYRITGPLNVRIHAPSGANESTGEAIIDVVRHQAKIEPPLSQLRHTDAISIENGIPANGEFFITTIAEITVYGETTNDRALSATGQLQVTFADFNGEG